MELTPLSSAIQKPSRQKDVVPTTGHGCKALVAQGYAGFSTFEASDGLESCL